MKIILKAKRPSNHPNPPFKEKEKGVKVDPKLGGQWKVPSLVANGRFQAWWPLECSKLGGHWKVKEKDLFTSSVFLQQLYLHLQFFPLTSRFYFTMVLSRYSRLSFLCFEL
jgi:hypothetical protein